MSDGVGVTTVRIAATSNRVSVRAEDRTDVEVEGHAHVTDDGSTFTVDHVTSALVVRVPTGSTLVAGTSSASIELVGRFGHVSLVSQSGRLVVDTAESVDARSTSARVDVGEVAGMCRIRSQSARVVVDRCGAADVATSSGRVVIRHADGPVHAHCVSGRIEIDLDTAHDVDAETVSGRITVRLPEGVRAHRPTGDGLDHQRPDGFACTVDARSSSGRVVVTNR